MVNSIKNKKISVCEEDYLNIKGLHKYLVENLNNFNIVELELPLYSLLNIMENYEKNM